MSQLHRILVAADFSTSARAAFDHALALSRVHDAELLAVHAVPADQRFHWHARERNALIGALRNAAQAAGVRLKVSVQHGNPAGVILLHASARGADLIVMGTSGRTGLNRFRFGSVAESVALKATQPVLVVPSNSARTEGAGTGFNSILVAVDLDHGSSAAVARALAMANERSRVTLLHVIPSGPLPGAHRYMYHLMEPEYQRHLARDAWQQIGAIIPASVRAARRVYARVVTGDPAAEIARVAAAVNADVVLVGVTPRRAIGRMLFGSTAVRVMRNAGRPVLAVPQQAAQPMVPDQFAIAA